jgi:FMN-dependent NADH-azoreductase
LARKNAYMVYLKKVMAIKSSTFGRVELSGQEAARFVQHMQEDQPNPAAQATLARGRDLLRQIFPNTSARAISVRVAK